MLCARGRRRRIIPAKPFCVWRTSATINRSDAEAVIAATPIDLGAVLEVDKPMTRARYDFAEIGDPRLADFVDAFLARVGVAGKSA
jgi:predicted GTPase